MPSGAPINIVSETVTLTKSGAWSSGTEYSDTVKLSKRFGKAGKILYVSVREDATSAEGNQGNVYITDGSEAAIGATTPESKMVYKFTGATLTGSATAASIDDNVAADGGSPYYLNDDDQLQVAAGVTAGGGSGTATILYVTVRAEVYR